MATKVTIQGQEYDYRFDLSALLCYEKLTGKLQEEMMTATPSSLSIVMHYSCLVSDDKFPMSLAGFVRAIDDQRTLDELNRAFAQEQERWNGKNIQLGEDKEEKAKGKKK